MSTTVAAGDTDAARLAPPSSAFAAVIELATAALDEPFERTRTLVAARIALQMLLDRCTTLQRELAAPVSPAPAAGDLGR